MRYHAAIDIGASSGRVILGHVDNGQIRTEEVFRFENKQVRRAGHDCWDLDYLEENILEGLAHCRSLGKIPTSLGIDTWGVDFVLLDAEGQRLGDAVAYRDDRTEGIDALVESRIPFSELYARTGIQKQIFNSIYQLVALQQEAPEQLEQAAHFLLIPDYLHYFLSGVIANEYTNATTTALVHAEAKTWDREVIRRLGLPERIFGDLSMPGRVLGGLRPEIAARVGYSCSIVLAPTHDTASAFLAVPALDSNSVYISSGTWSLLGLERPEPLTDLISQTRNFTNEGGCDYRFRYLKNIMGLWMIQSIRRELNGTSYVAAADRPAAAHPDFSAGKHDWTYPELSAAAATAADFPARIDVNAPIFLAPDSMTAAVLAYCESHGQSVPVTLAELMSVVYTSLADDYVATIAAMEEHLQTKFNRIHIVGGGSQDQYLNHLTARACRLPVLAGPVEASALGNLIVQFIAAGDFPDLDTARTAIRNSFSLKEILS